MTWSISDEETVDKGAKFLSDRWIALEQGTQNHHQQIDQMMKILQLHALRPESLRLRVEAIEGYCHPKMQTIYQKIGPDQRN